MNRTRTVPTWRAVAEAGLAVFAAAAILALVALL